MIRNQELLTELANVEGFNSDFDLIEANYLDSVVPGICQMPGCGYTTEVKPDSREGWCEECNKGTVISCIELMMGILLKT